MIGGSLLADLRLRKAFLLYHLLKKRTQMSSCLVLQRLKHSTPLGKTCTLLPPITHPSPCSSGNPDYTVPKVCQHSQSCCLYLHSLQELVEAIGKTVQTNKKSLEQIISDRQGPH
ncbi:hypothetical protein E2C01_058338 [Portunus trituberculatus]|uniref:Uncharacterized protein n=1 Tax=Portunus trituberculatus TaxID=210409 RepID=A0A5B7H4F7_PORTR|nr:hypothetical protein [Portunus trituberculatus]